MLDYKNIIQKGIENLPEEKLREIAEYVVFVRQKEEHTHLIEDNLTMLQNLVKEDQENYNLTNISKNKEKENKAPSKF